MDIKTLVTHDLNMQSEIFKLLSKNLQNLKQPHFIKLFFDCMHFSKKNVWPKTTEYMKIAQKQEKVNFFVHKIQTMGNIVYQSRVEILVYHFRGISNFSPSVCPIPLLTETCL